MAGKIWVVDKAVEVEQWHPDHLRSPVALGRRVAVGDRWVIIFHIKLPGDAGSLQTVEDGRHICQQCGQLLTFGDLRVVAATQYMWLAKLPSLAELKKWSKRT